MYAIIKIASSALLIFLISEIAKRSSFWGAVLASLPFISIIAFIFLYQETKDANKVGELSMDIFWLVIPSLALFLVLSFMIKQGYDFYIALLCSALVTIVAYFIMGMILKNF